MGLFDKFKRKILVSAPTEQGHETGSGDENPVPLSHHRAKRRYRTVKKLLTRGPIVEPLSDGHLRYLWAAYRRGSFPHMPEGISEAMFAEGIAREAEGGRIRVMTGPTQFGRIPVGIAVVGANALHGMLSYTTSVLWFPEASPRNKLECLALLATELLALGHIVVSTTGPEVAIFDHLVQYRLLKRVGWMKDFTGPGEHIAVYYGQSRKG